MINIEVDYSEFEDIQLGIANLILIEKKKDIKAKERIEYLEKLLKRIDKANDLKD